MENWFWILGWSLSILNIAGNGLVIFVVCRKQRLRTKTKAFIVSLAAADFFVGMSAVPSLYFYEMTCGYHSQGVLCDEIDFIRWLFGYASDANLCSLVLDRFVAVARPLRSFPFSSPELPFLLVTWSAKLRALVAINGCP